MSPGLKTHLIVTQLYEFFKDEHLSSTKWSESETMMHVSNKPGKLPAQQCTTQFQTMLDLYTEESWPTKGPYKDSLNGLNKNPYPGSSKGLKKAVRKIIKRL